MAESANTPRYAAVKLLEYQLKALHLTCGLLIKTTRSYKRAGKPNGYKQVEVARSSGLTQSEVSRIENGRYIPDDRLLGRFLGECGFVLNGPGGDALLNLLKCLRNTKDVISEIRKEQPM